MLSYLKLATFATWIATSSHIALVSAYRLPASRVQGRRPIPDTTQSTPTPTKSDDLCFSPVPSQSSASNASEWRGVPSFMDSIITNRIQPNGGIEDWLTKFTSIFQDSTAMNCFNVDDPSCKVGQISTLSPITSTNGDQSPPLSDCQSLEAGQDGKKEAYWTLVTAANFHDVMAVFLGIFDTATFATTYDISSISGNITIKAPSTDSKSLLTNIASAFSISGAATGVASGPLGGALGVIGGIISVAANNIKAPTTPSTEVALDQKMKESFQGIQDAVGALLKAMFLTGTLDDVKGLENSYPPGSTYKNSISKFLDQGRFFYGTHYLQEDDLRKAFTDNLRMNLVSVALTEANYYILKDGFSPDKCPTGNSGVVIDGSCFTLEAAGPGGYPLAPGTRERYTVEAEREILDFVTKTHKINLDDLYQVSYDCEQKHNAYNVQSPIGTINFDTSTRQNCFYDVPVIQASYKDTSKVSNQSPCYVVYNKDTGQNKKAGSTFLPDNLAHIFDAKTDVYDFCAECTDSAGICAGT
ncbi:hypothetical protein SUNI508_06682 [Seiridium unicorne]|uniref:Uncharacterized protein n=1 Tax=Seiridium unicorne TaxID=138068 RepID=A0ABR2UZN1_9PEZI